MYKLDHDFSKEKNEKEQLLDFIDKFIGENDWNDFYTPDKVRAFSPHSASCITLMQTRLNAIRSLHSFMRKRSLRIRCSISIL